MVDIKIKPKDVDTLALFKTNSSIIAIRNIKKESYISCALNGRDILSLDSNIRDMSLLLRDIIVSRLGNKKDRIEAYKIKPNIDSINFLIECIETSSHKVLLRNKFNEKNVIQDSLPKFDILNNLDISDLYESSLFKDRLINFNQLIKDMFNRLTACRNDSLDITGHKFIDTMWGADIMSKFMSDINRSISNDKEWDRIEYYVEGTNKLINCLIYNLEDKNKLFDKNTKSLLADKIIPEIIDNYIKIKCIISRILLSLSKLVYIEDNFRKVTNYPIKWFVNTDILEDLKKDYNNLIGFTVSIPNIEAQIFNTLLTLKKCLEV